MLEGEDRAEKIGGGCGLAMAWAAGLFALVVVIGLVYGLMTGDFTGTG